MPQELLRLCRASSAHLPSLVGRRRLLPSLLKGFVAHGHAHVGEDAPDLRQQVKAEKESVTMVLDAKENGLEATYLFS